MTNTFQHHDNSSDALTDQADDRLPLSPWVVVKRLVLPAVAWATPVLYLYWMHVRGIWETNSSAEDLLPICIVYGVAQVLSWGFIVALWTRSPGAFRFRQQVQFARQQQQDNNNNNNNSGSSSRSRSSSPKRRSNSPASIVPVTEDEPRQNLRRSASPPSLSRRDTHRETASTDNSLFVLTDDGASSRRSGLQRSHSVPHTLTSVSVLNLTPPSSILRKDGDSDYSKRSRRRCHSMDTSGRSFVRFNPKVQVIQVTPTSKHRQHNQQQQEPSLGRTIPPPFVLVVEGSHDVNMPSMITPSDKHENNPKTHNHSNDGNNVNNDEQNKPDVFHLLQDLKLKLAQIRQAQAELQEQMQAWRVERALRNQQAGLSAKAAAAADLLQQEEFRQARVHLVQQEDEVLREMQKCKRQLVEQLHNKDKESSSAPMPVSNEVSRPLHPSCLGFISLAIKALLQLIQVCLVALAVSHVSATIVALMHATLYVGILGQRSRGLTIACIVSLVQTTIIAWWHDKNCCPQDGIVVVDDYYERLEPSKNHHRDRQTPVDYMSSGDDDWWKGLLFATFASFLAVLMYGGGTMPCVGNSAWNRFLQRQFAPVGSLAWVKQLTFETVWVVLLVTSIMAIVDIRGSMTWENEEGDSWRSDTVAWGALSVVWGAARAVLLLSPPDVPKGPTNRAIFWLLAPTMAAIVVWVVLLIGSRWDDALQDDEQDWILPDSLLYLGAAIVLTAGTWASAHSDQPIQ